jgi:hypothetical protein
MPKADVIAFGGQYILIWVNVSDESYLADTPQNQVILELGMIK